MPPRNPNRSLFSEEGLARRVALEREQRGWTYEGLAKRMTDAGCPINQSALYKIEKGTKGKDGQPGPARRITVDELVALAQVFDTTPEDLLLPPDLKAAGVGLELWQEVERSTRALHDTTSAYYRAIGGLRRHLERHPAAAATVLEYVRQSAPEMEEWALAMLKGEVAPGV
jgi:transcriptional regulator with XRE-family HTH domain